LPISMVSCAFATTGTIAIANVRPINLHLIVVVLDAGSARDLKTAAATRPQEKRSLALLMLI
jgi:hypothetical protein